MRAALIPMKLLGDAKMRLAGLLDERERSDLALAMLVDVITACRDSEMFDEIAVVSGDGEVFWHAREAGAKALAEPATLAGLNDSLTFGVRYLARRQAADEVVIFPADLPLLRAEDVCTIVNALAGAVERRVVLVRAADGGTNALALRPPEVIPMRFGPDSAAEHAGACEAAGVECVVLALPRVAFDVDAVADVESLADRAVGGATRGWLDALASYGPSSVPGP